MAEDRTAATPSPRKASRWFWFAVGFAAGELFGLLSLHFLTRPSIELNWPVVGVALAGVTAIVLIAWRRDA